MQIFVTILMFVGIIVYLAVGGFLGVLCLKKIFKEDNGLDVKILGAILGMGVAVLVGVFLIALWNFCKFVILLTSI